MNKTIRFIQISLFILFFASTYALSAAHQLNISGSRLTADFRNMPLTAIINDIGAKTGISFVFLGGGAASEYNRPFSFRFESMPVRAVLEKLLSGFNFSFISDDKENIRQVFILGSKPAAGSGANTRAPFVMTANSVPDVREEPAANSSPEGMEITQGEGMETTKGEGMQVTPGEGMQVTPGEGMQVTPGEGMQVGPGKGMEIGPPSAEGMSSNLSGNEGVNVESANAEGVANNYPDTQTKKRPPVRRPGRRSLKNTR